MTSHGCLCDRISDLLMEINFDNTANLKVKYCPFCGKELICKHMKDPRFGWCKNCGEVMK